MAHAKPQFIEAGNTVVTPEDKSERKEVSLRRVYALPGELVDRITDYQREKGFSSEVEAVRRLLDEALKSRDDLTKIINRFLSRLPAQRVASEVAKDVLVGHPLVAALAFGAERVSFELKNGERATISDKGQVTALKVMGLFGAENAVTWKSGEAGNPFAGGAIDAADDDIPF